MEKRLALITVVFVICAFLNAETSITLPLQGFRNGDVLYKQQIEYKDPGRNGSNVVWDFSRLQSINENYKLRYYQPPNTRQDTQCITGVEHRTRYKYGLIRDSLFLTGFENSGSNIVFSNPQLCLRFPFTFRDSISQDYGGNGIYMNMLYVETVGNSYSIADAKGTLILPEEDTIYHVLRIRSQQEYIQKTCPKEYTPLNHHSLLDSVSVLSIDSMRLANTDTIYFRTETCRWYAPGYRYPVFETICNHSRSVLDTTEMGDVETAFYFPPSMHNYLENDPDNMAVLDNC
jgi:hypothetical protein